MNALSMAGYFCWLSADRFTGPGWVLPAVFLTWLTTCTLSRFYMGAHSPADVCVGLLLGAAGLAVNFALGDAFDAWLLSSAHVWWAVPLAIAALMLAYPRAARPAWTSSPGDTAIIEGVVCGVFLGVHAHAHAHVAAIGKPVDFSQLTPAGFVVAAGACLLGFAALVAVRGVVKAVASRALLAFWGPRYGPIEDLLSAAEVSEAEKRDAAAAAEAALEAARKFAAAAAAAASSAAAVAATSSSSDDTDPAAAPGAATATPTSSGAVDAVPTPQGSGRADSVASPASESDDSDPCNDVGSASAPASADGVRRRTGAAAAQSSAPPSGAAVPAAPGIPAPGSAGAAVPASSAVAAAAPLVVGGPPTGGLVLLPPGRRYEVELPLKLITYTAVGFNAVYTVPLIFQFLGLAQYGM